MMKKTANTDQHEEMVNILLEEKSLEALCFLLESGRELEFEVFGDTYFISRDKAREYVSVWNGQEEQSFDSIIDLIEQAVIREQTFSQAWKKARILTLF